MRSKALTVEALADIEAVAVYDHAPPLAVVGAATAVRVYQTRGDDLRAFLAERRREGIGAASAAREPGTHSPAR